MNLTGFECLTTELLVRCRSVSAIAAAIVFLLGGGSATAQHGGSNADTAPPSAKHEQKYAFEWGGVYELPAGVADLVIQPGPDASIDIALVPVSDASDAAFDAAVTQAVRTFEGDPKAVQPGEEFAPGTHFHQLRVESEEEMRFKVRLSNAGRFALFTQHFADEFQTIFVFDGQKIFPSAQRNFRDRFGQIVIQPAALKAFGIKIEQANTHTLTPSFTAPARVAFNTERMAHVGSAVIGRVSSLPVRQGDPVKVGDTLLVVDSPELGEAQSDYLQRRTLAESAAPIVELARDAFERGKKLYEESKGTTLNEVQKRQAELQAAESALINAKAAMRASQNRLRLLGMDEQDVKSLSETGAITPKYTIRAPIDGRVIRRDVTLGELVRPDRDALMVVADTSRLWVLVEVPEVRLREVALNAPVRITLAAFPGKIFEGAVSFISADLNEATRTAQIRVEVGNADALLRPGMFAQAEIVGAATEDETNPNGGQVGREPGGVLAVPEAAVQTIDGKSVVFVPFAEKPNTFLKRPVTLGPAVNGMLPVSFGLREGESIVATATFILKAELGKSTAKHEH